MNNRKSFKIILNLLPALWYRLLLDVTAAKNKCRSERK
ncbi:hypothetical protein PRO82_002231 [Candidatus Protochlamydia amoebophila]|nr:hypothetical protein [Candidatus Protochlamydia amoebophila]